MTPRAVSHAAAAARTSLALLAGVGLVALGACEQRPEPHPTYTQAPPPPPAPLAGEPEAAPSMAPPAPTPSEPAPAPSAAPSQGLVAMAPIPNPEEPAPAPKSHARGPASGAARRPLHHHGRVHHAYAPAKAAPAHATRAAPKAHPATPAHPAPKPAVKTAPHPAAKPPPVVVPAKPAAAPVHEHRATRHELAKANGASNTTANATANGTAETADARTEALRSDLSGALAKGAVLSVPKATPDGASDVTLTVPADFYDTLQEQAGQHAMSDAAASVNLDATLSGDGWSIIPAGAQSQPLHAGMPTLFKWTVTAVKSATGTNAGPLRADVNADLLGGGSKTLALGAINEQSAGGGGFHWWGAVLLAVVVLLGLGFLLRGSRTNTPPPGRRRPAGEVRRPFDMTNGNGDYRP